MAVERTTKAQVQAYRFGMRRLERAVATGQAYERTIGGARHGLSVLIGFIVAALLLAGFAVYGLVKPAPSIGDATVLLDDNTGAAYVLRDGRLYPAMNFTSALLAAGQANGTSGPAGSATGRPAVKSVKADTLAGLPRGQLLGIPGAPTTLPGASALLPAAWTVCDVSRTDPALPPSSPPTITTTAVIGSTTHSQQQVGNAPPC